MSAVMEIRGAGGGKSGGGGGGLTEEPDTLSSVALARFVDLIGEGQIHGLVNNEYSIYLDGVPLKNLTGTPNYKPFRWVSRVGTQAQTPIPGFAGTQQENSVGVKLLQTSGRLVRSIPDAQADAVRVTVAVQGLTTTSSKGRISGGEVAYKISARVDAGTWKVIYDGSIKGKTNSRYQRSHEIPLASLGAGPYEVGVERVTADAESALIVDDLFWDSFTVINYEQFAYPNSALIALEIDARYFSSVPTRSYHVRGLLIRVPTNYNPITRVYATSGAGTTAGAWDGTFKIAWSDSPAWCYYDLVTNPRYGLGKKITAAQVDKWSLYQIGKYCDGLVPTGNTLNVFQDTSSASVSVSGKVAAGVPVMSQVLEPRFRLNCVLNTKEDAYRVLNQLASVFRGMAFWSGSSLTLTQDRPTADSMIYTNSNVIDGEFNYEGSSRSQRHTTVLVGWNDPKEDFKQKFEYVEDRDGIARYGIRNTEIVAFGTTSRTQARRLGLWMLYTERMETDAISFRVGQDSAKVMPGDVVQILDNNRAGARWAGRVHSATTTTVTMDAPLDLVAGSYTLTVRAQDGTLTKKAVNIASAGTFTTLTVTVAFAVAPAVAAMWSLSSNALQPVLGRVISIRQDGPINFALTVLKHDPTKYAAIELGAPLANPDYSFLSVKEVDPVTGLSLTENTFKPTVTSQPSVNLDVAWDLSKDPMIRGYRIKVVGSNKVVQNLPEQSDPSLTLTELQPITYTVTVNAVNVFGIVGPGVTLSKTLTGIDTSAPADVTGVNYVLDPNVGVKVGWAEVEDFIDYYEVRRGATWGTATLVARVKANTYLLGPQTSTAQTILVKAVDTSGNYSVNAGSVVVSATAPVGPSVSYALAMSNEVISWATPASSFTVDRFEIRYGSTWAGGTFVTSTKGASHRRQVDYAGARRYWVAAIDIAGNVGTPSSIDVSITSPGSVLGGRSEVVDNNVLVFWNPPSTGSLPVDRYEVRKGASWVAGVVVGSNGNSTFAAIFEQQAGTYTYWIAAYDSAGNVGTPVGIVATVSQPPDYVLRTDINSTFTGTKTNMVVSEGLLVGPSSTTETFADHFSTRGYATPQAQITAGYPRYLSPSLTSGSYVEAFDYGSVLPATTVQATLGYTVVSGSVTVACQIAYKLNIGDPWTNVTAGVTNVLISNFRYVQVTWTFTCTAGANLIQIDSFNLKLSNKLKTDSGAGTITVAASGVVIPFNVAFIDADTPIVQPNGATPLTPVVDFVDAPNPTDFTVYLYNSAGAKVTGSFSWTARGY